MSQQIFLSYESYYFKRIERTISYMIYVGLGMIVLFIPKDMYFVESSQYHIVFLTRSIMFILTLGILLSFRTLAECKFKIKIVLTFMTLSAMSIVLNYAFVPNQLPYLTSSLIYYLFAIIVLAPLLTKRLLLLYFFFSSLAILFELLLLNVEMETTTKIMIHLIPAFIFIYFVATAIRQDAIKSYKIDYVNFKYSHLDGLTLLYNRRYWRRKSTFIMRDKKNPLFSVVILDIDNFKQINDMYSHECGDRVIKAIAANMLKLANDKTICGRYGGDEFVITFKGKDIAETKKIIEDLKYTLTNTTFDFKEKAFKITLSAGISQNKGLQSIKSVLNSADEKLLQAKQQGKNQIIT
jgi:diguanylate cyclase (GGDEF)-like protein